jgi:hypothetical protein
MSSSTNKEPIYDLNKTYSLVGDKNFWVEFTGEYFEHRLKQMKTIKDNQIFFYL